MKVAYVAPVVYPFVKGGAEKRMHEIGRRLVSRGHDVTVYSRHWWNGPEVYEHEGITLRAVAPERDIYADGDRRSVTSALGLSGRLLRPLFGADHDVLLTPVAPYFHVFTARAAAAWIDCPVVVTWHEVWGEYWYDHMGAPGVFGDAVERLTGLLPQHAVVGSETVADDLCALRGMDSDGVEVISNGIEVEEIRSTEPATDGFDVLYAGRLIEDKNVDLVLDALDRLDRDVTLGVVGDGPQFDALTAHARELDCADRVTFLGFLDDYADVLAQMRAARVFASPSVREGFGITFLEAMAADCTVVAAEHPNSAGSEVVGDAGFVTEPTVEGVTEALERALAGDRPPRDPVEAAETYDWDSIADEVEQYLQGLVTPDAKGDDEAGKPVAGR